MRSSIDSVLRLAESGDLQFVSVIGLARSGSTIVCRRLGARLDGAVYEPATPAQIGRNRHFARTILAAHARARRQLRTVRPVALAIKDLALFLDDDMFAVTQQHAAHVVFTIREPAAQQASLTRQLAHEFSPLQRFDAVIRHPFEALWMAWYFLVFGRRFIGLARQELGAGGAPLHRLAMAGWNLESWHRLERQLAAIGASRATVLDSSALRGDPAEIEARLERTAATIAPSGPRASVEMAGHSRMLPRSAWAKEALASRAIASGADRFAAAAPDAFESALLAVTQPAYRRVLDIRGA